MTTTIYTADRMLDVRAAAIVDDAAVAIDNGLIAYAGPRAGIGGYPPGAAVVACGDRTLMPGLIDAHVHFFGVDTLHTECLFTQHEAYRVLRAARDAGALLDAGYTSVRCLGSSVGPHLARAIADGVVRGPRVIAAGQFICSTAGTWDETSLPRDVVDRLDLYADGEDECRAIVRRRIRGGAGVIKVGISSGSVEDHFKSWGDRPDQQKVAYSVPEIRAAVDEAHRFEVKVSAHAIGDEAVRSAIKAGVDVIEHAHGISSETRDLLAETGSIVVPTLTHMSLMASTGAKFGMSGSLLETAAEHAEEQLKSFQQLLAAGITVAAGSDLIGPPWAGLGQASLEPRLMAQGGMTSAQALQAALLTNAEVLGIAREAGALEAGLRADVIAVRGNPLADINALQDVDLVVKGGTIERNGL